MQDLNTRTGPPDTSYQGTHVNAGAVGIQYEQDDFREMAAEFLRGETVVRLEHAVSVHS
jgi:hypothetical protein